MLIGLAVGDALGTTLEFVPRAQVQPVETIVGGGPFRLPAGYWTDDTSMALCLAHSLLHQGRWVARDVMNRFVNWRDVGYLSSTGTCFDIGNQTSAALDRYLSTGDPMAGPVDEAQSGNGGIMRLAPVVLAFGACPGRTDAIAREQSSLTHASPSCLQAASDIARFLRTGDRQGLPRPITPPTEATGWVRDTLQAAHWAMTQGADFRTVLLAAVNLGGDADTVGAVTGQMAGRLWGYSGIPEDWRRALHAHDTILDLADQLFDMDPDGIDRDDCDRVKP
ncbi:ADP-ribosylglycohydrolase family protein [Tropicibacter sp. S64]|uniref:ADP-ribosylglycohydrolase family protein n=1 Tax=Tropicibacter sp. S64 TaxID=3415122 RepID=UPI003C7CCDB3